MNTFAVIMLVVLLVTLTHVHNWIARETFEAVDDDYQSWIIINFITLILYIAAITFLVNYIVEWGNKV